MSPSWLKTALIVGGVIIAVLAVVFLCMLVAGADASRRRQPQSKEKNSLEDASQIDKKEKS